MLPEDFPLADLPDLVDPPGLVDDNHTVTDIEQAFKRIAPNGDALACQDGNKFPPITYTHVQLGGVNEAKNHFQGVQRLRDGRHIVVSGAFGTGARKHGHVFVIRMGSRPPAGAWGSNIIFNAQPLDDDAVIGVYGFGQKFWHPGGISVLGDILAVPLQNAGEVRIAFLHTKNPAALEQFNDVAFRARHSKAGAVALTKLPDGHFVCAVWREVPAKPQGRIDFYLSKEPNFHGGFDHTSPLTWKFSGIPDDPNRDAKYQNINFVTEVRPSGARRLFLIGTENGSAAAPASNGPNFADLWEVDLSADAFSGVGAPQLEHVATAEFRGLREYCNFDAGAGVYIDPKGGLHLYSCYHHRVANELRLSEFRSYPPSNIDSIDDAWIELYEHDSYRGKTLCIHGKTEAATISDYRQIFVGGGDFDERVSSVRYQLPSGHTYRLFRERDFATGRKKAFIDLKGNGKLKRIRNLKHKPHKFGDKVSSSRYV